MSHPFSCRYGKKIFQMIDNRVALTSISVKLYSLLGTTVTDQTFTPSHNILFPLYVEK